MARRSAVSFGVTLVTASLLVLGCGSSTSSDPGGTGLMLSAQAGNGQTAVAGSALAPYQLRVVDADGLVQEGVAIAWTVRSGCGSVSAAVSSTNALGIATTTATLGTLIGAQEVRAQPSAGGPTFDFVSTASAAPAPSFQVLAGCNNVPERYTSDLWVADGYAYTGTWGFRGANGNALKIWKLDGSGAPVLQDSIIRAGIGTVSDVEVSSDGQWLVFTAEQGDQDGLYVYQLTAPGQPVFRARHLVNSGLHTGALSVIGGKLYAFAAKDPPNCALYIYDLSTAASGVVDTVSSTPIPDNYCIHDTFVRDGYAFVFAWNSGLYIFDVGNGALGGTPAVPKLVSHTSGYGGKTHNGWWFWNPTNGEKKYLFIGEEGPGTVGVSSSGSIHVVDVTNLSTPVEVASYTLAGAGTHNFWVDEQAQVLYAAFYNGGVVALDISGTLTGDLAAREIARVRPGGPGHTYVWGVMLYNGALYASDMVSGLWQVAVPQ